MIANDGWVGYEWDEAKRAGNIRKHGVDFERVWDFVWAESLVVEDRRFEYGERQFLAHAPIGGRVHTMVFTRRDGLVRVISLRVAHKKELMMWLAR